jgi:hypothetical protein
VTPASDHHVQMESENGSKVIDSHFESAYLLSEDHTGRPSCTNFNRDDERSCLITPGNIDSCNSVNSGTISLLISLYLCLVGSIVLVQDVFFVDSLKTMFLAWRKEKKML